MNLNDASQTHKMVMALHKARGPSSGAPKNHMEAYGRAQVRPYMAE